MKPLLLVMSFLVCIPSARADELTDRVDKLIAQWDRPHSPGCALGVVKDGKLIYETAAGMADVEQGRRIGPETVFHIASISKQFAAMAILLLEKDGKLSLDDDVRKHLPELHDFGKKITLRHLLQHTSGLRDQWDLLTLAGWRMSDVITEDDVFRLVCRQRALNFEPGARHLYSNTGYTLAARVVERVSGGPFRDFCRQRIFEPLGMVSTRFPANYEEIVENRARSYNPAGPGKFRNSILSYGTVGATSLLTTVSDLKRWDDNFYEPKVGDAELLARFQEVGTLNDGKKISYALGLDIGEYRGLKTVEHGGADAGFRCTLLRFPEQRFSVILLANTGEFNPGDLARKVADIYLEGKLKPTPTRRKAAERKEVTVDPKLFDAYVGEYQIMPGMMVTVLKDGGKLTARASGDRRVTLTAASDREFFVKGEDIAVTFDEPTEGKCPSLIAHLGSQSMPARRFFAHTVTAEQAEECVGDFYSDELAVIYSVSRKGDKLIIRHPRVEGELRPASKDVFQAPRPIGQVTFTRGDDGKVTGFKTDGGRVQNLRFRRVKLDVPGEGAK